MLIKIFGMISIFIGVFIMVGFFSEFMIAFNFDFVAFIRIISASAFFILGFFVCKGKVWAKIGFLLLMGFNALLSSGGVYFFSFPLTIVPSPNAHWLYLKTSLIFAWIPFLISLFFLIKKDTNKILE